MRDELIELLKTNEEIKKLIKDIAKDKKHKSEIEDINKQDKKAEEIEMLKGLVEKWKKCFSDEKIKTQDLTDALQNKDTEFQSLEQQKNRLSQEINELQQLKSQKEKELQQTQSTNTKLNKTIEFYRNNFEDELRVYELFLDLSDNTKSSLKGIFKDNSLKGFLACGIQEKNISSLWDYIKSELIEDKNPDSKKLVEIFNFLFTNYSLAFPMYQLQEVNVGDSYDTELHINHSSSSGVSGAIKEVLLRGWINTKNNKIIKPSVVVI